MIYLEKHDFNVVALEIAVIEFSKNRRELDGVSFRGLVCRARGELIRSGFAWDDGHQGICESCGNCIGHDFHSGFRFSCGSELIFSDKGTWDFGGKCRIEETTKCES